MQINLLKNIIGTLVGQAAAGIVDILYGQKNVNEFVIQKKLKLTINQTRNILYKLADEGIVSFTKKKDKKKGGWYTYFWTLNTGKGLEKFREHLTKAVNELKSKLNLKKTERFFYCNNCQIEVNEENALLQQYTCAECGEVLEIKDKLKEVASLEKEIARIESILSDIEKEIGEISKKEGFVKARKIKFEAKKKVKERALRKKIKAKELKKLARKEKRAKKKGEKKQVHKKPAKQAKSAKGLGSKLRNLFGV